MSSTTLPDERSEPILRLHHGTDESSATDLLRDGVDERQAAVFNVSGEFWGTTGLAEAETFAQVNPAAGLPTIYSFDIPLQVLQAMLTANPPRAYQHTTSGVDWYEFLPKGFPLLNLHMANRQIDPPAP